MLQSTHIMKSVAKLDDDNTNILIHCDKHFSYILSLYFFSCRKRNLTKFSYTVNKKCNLVAELLPDIFKVILRILNHIVQKCTHNTLIVHSELIKNFSNGYRMHNIRLTRTPTLIFVSITCKVISFFNHFTVILRIFLYIFKKFIKAVVIIIRIYTLFLVYQL